MITSEEGSNAQCKVCTQCGRMFILFSYVSEDSDLCRECRYPKEDE